MTPWIEAIALWMADFYLAATILLIIACAMLCFVQQPARRMAVAWGTLISLLVAAILCQSASRPRVDPRRFFAGPLRPAVRFETTAPQSAEPPVSESSFVHRQTARLPQADLERPVEVVAEPQIAIESAPRAGIDPQTIAGGAVALFLAGTVFTAARLVNGAWQASRLVRKSLAAPRGLVDELREIVGGQSRLPGLRLNVDFVTPVATGALWPTIVLPKQFVEKSARGERRAVLGHEWAHIRNGDLWLLALDRCLLPLLWAHPVYWWLRRRMRQDQEYLADAAAASLTGPADYAAQLVAWARDLAGVREIVAPNAVGIWERPSEFALRISTILNQADRITLRCSGRVRTAVVACLAAVSLIAVSVSVRPPNADSAPPQAQAPPTTTAPTTTAEIRLGPDDIGGTCLNKEEKPVSAVKVDLYQLRFDGSQRFVGQTSTNEAGQFVFRHVSPPINPRDGMYSLVVRSKGYATKLQTVQQRRDCAEIKLQKAATLKGIVKDRQGKPIKGALVFQFWDRSSLYTPIPGIRCAVTDAKGVFAIDDLEEYKFIEPDVPVAMRLSSYQLPPGLVIRHPDYEGTPVPFTKVPDQLDIVLDKGAVITGMVVDGETGRPAPGLTVALQGIDKQMAYVPVREDGRLTFALQGVDKQSRKAQDYWTTARTDQGGRYRLTSIPAGKFNVYLRENPPGLTSAALDSFEVRQGQTVEAPPIRLIKGGLIKGRLIEDATGQPATLTAVERASIGAHGPSRPRSGGSIQGARVKDDGTFEIRLPPGTNWIYVSGKGPFEVAGEIRTGFGAVVHEIQVVEGAEYNIEFRVTRVLAPDRGTVKRTYTARSSVRVVDDAVPPSAGAKQTPQTGAGRFVGTVRLQGKAPEPDLPVQDSRGKNGRLIRDESLRINRTVDNGIAGVFIYLAQAPSGTAAAVPPQPFVLSTDATAFSPRAGIARVGQTLRVRNDSRKFTNVHLFPSRNPVINHLLQPGQQVDLARFATPERAPLEIRDDRQAWMRGVLLVVDHPFAAVTDELGAFEIVNLPPGKYSFRVWHERAGFLDKQLTVDIRPGETTKKTLSYGLDRFE
jgi:beta-lactamase regulating signal transducer with metallopeptidase domain/protocatechuate 3,4-dioxygenase beta subunit